MVKYSLFTSISYPPVPQQYYSVSDRYLIGIWTRLYRVKNEPPTENDCVPISAGCTC